MTSFAEVILRSINPFDNMRTVHFWHQPEQAEVVVEYIHQDAFIAIEEVLNQVIQDHSTRTVLINGESGSGKTYLLGRLRKQFNYKAFFVAIPPFPLRDGIWRHVLRYTCNTLVYVSENKKEPPFLTWLSATKQRIKDDLLDFLRSDRQKFIAHLKETYKQDNIHNAESFFGVLYDLTIPELFPKACEYLRGDDLSEDDLQALRLKRAIDTETSAREMLTNLSQVVGIFQPIVLCFDQINSIARLPDGSIDLLALFDINTKIREEGKNLLLIIAASTHTWEENKSTINKADKAYVDKKIELKGISLAQAEILLASKLHILHSQANPQPPSPIYPLNRQMLEKKFPEGRTIVRDLLIWARDVFQTYKEWLTKNTKNASLNLTELKEPLKISGEALKLADFKVKWREEFTMIQQRITKLNQLSSPELIQMFQDVLLALGIQGIVYPLFVRTKYASYSIGYELTGKSGLNGVVWSEDPNMTSFLYVIEACRNKLERDPSLKLSLIRAESLGSSKIPAFQAFEEIFVNSPHRHITPTLDSVHFLATYASLARDAKENDLVINGKIIHLEELQSLINKTQTLHYCQLLQNLGIVKKPKHKDSEDSVKNLTLSARVNEELHECKDYILDLVITQEFLSRKNLIQSASIHFLELTETQIDGLIQQLCWDNKIKMIDPKAPLESQLICLFPKK